MQNPNAYIEGKRANNLSQNEICVQPLKNRYFLHGWKRTPISPGQTNLLHGSKTFIARCIRYSYTKYAANVAMFV